MPFLLGLCFDAKAEDPTLVNWFSTATGYDVFPSVMKGGIGWGGARGKGLSIQGDTILKAVTLTQVTVGLQLGGQVYAEFIFFKAQTALDEFTRGNFEMGAQVSTVALPAVPQPPRTNQKVPINSAADRLARFMFFPQ